MEETSTSQYKGIFKTTFLFGSVQVFTILISIVKNKVIAILLDTSGIGMIGLFTSSFTMIQSAAGLGIDQSSVRNISEANHEDNHEKNSKTIVVIRRLLWFTSSLGAIITILFSKKLSLWTFGSENYRIAYILLSIVVFLNIFNLGQHAILQGMRMLKFLAKASIIGSVFGLLLSLPLYYFLGEDGIVPSLILTGLSTVLISRYFTQKIQIQKIKINYKETISISKNMIKLGTSLMMMSFIISGAGLILRSYISNHGNVDQVGIFQAGYTIIYSYFGMVFTAMSKDYFPRLSSINKDNLLVTNAVNQQAEVSLLLIGPLVILMLFLTPTLIRTLYTASFLQAVSFVNFAVFGIIFQCGSQTMGLILIAKNRGDIFIYTVLVFQALFLLNNILLYNFFGMTGLGLGFAVNMLIHLIGIQIVLYKSYKITFSKRFFSIMAITLTMSIIAFFTNGISILFIRYLIGLIIIILSILFTISQLKNIMGVISIKQALIDKFSIKQ